MYKIKKTFEVAISHHLRLPYNSPCQRNHGHNLKIVVYVASEELNREDMVIDFTRIKERVHGQLDHEYLNDIEGLGWERRPEGGIRHFNPTAERIAEWVCVQIDKCYRVDVQESTGNIATYMMD